MTPNLLFLYTDEQRFDTLAAYGNRQIEMPNLNRLAEASCVCDAAFVTQPVCTPARSSILSGLMPHANGCTHNNLPLEEEIPVFPKMLPLGKYTTAHFGKWHLGDEVFAQHGFDHWAATEEYQKHYRPHRDPAAVSHYTRWLKNHGFQPAAGERFSRTEAARLPEQFSKPAFLAETASAFIREHAERPFCLYVNFLEPHMPFTGPRDGQYDPSGIPLPENFDCPPTEANHLKARYRHAIQSVGLRHGTTTSDPDSMRRLIARYWGLCSQVDTHCGTILEALRASGQWDNTIIVFTSDHGDMMGSHQLIEKSLMYDESVRVPLLVKLPGQHSMHRIEGPVGQVDLVPTLLELMGAEPPSHLHGKSRASALASENARFDDPVVVEWNPAHISESYLKKAPQDFPFPREACRAADRDPIRTIISGEGRWKLCVSVELRQHELYDRSEDPGECQNIFGRDNARQVSRDLLVELRRWQKITGDPVALPDL